MNREDNTRNIDLYNIRNCSDYYTAIKYFHVPSKNKDVNQVKKNKIVHKIESIRDTIALEKVKEVLINEYNNGYYDNAANIGEMIDLGTEFIGHEGNEFFDKTRYHVKNMVIYSNGMPKFNDFSLTLSGIYIPEEKDEEKEEEKVRTKKRHRPKRRSNRRKK